MALDLEEQEQVDEAKAWWKQHGNKVIWGVTAFLLVAAGWRGWQTWTHTQAAEASMLFDQAVQAASMNDLKTAKDLPPPRSWKTMPAAPTVRRPPGWPDASIWKQATSRARARSTNMHWIMPATTVCANWPICAWRPCTLKRRIMPGAMKRLETEFDPAFQGLVEQLKGDVLAAQGKSAEARAAYKLALEKLGDKSSLKPLVEIRLDSLGRLMCEPRVRILPDRPDALTL
jgi:predicted negative regulator of RcsB-dependent stress response